MTNTNNNEYEWLPGTVEKIKMGETLQAVTHMRPRCRKHKVDMYYDPTQCLWCCPAGGCQATVFPAPDDFVGEGKRLRTIKDNHVRFQIESQPDKPNKVYLVLGEHNARLDITQYVTDVTINKFASSTLASLKTVIPMVVHHLASNPPSSPGTHAPTLIPTKPMPFGL